MKLTAKSKLLGLGPEKNNRSLCLTAIELFRVHILSMDKNEILKYIEAYGIDPGKANRSNQYNGYECRVKMYMDEFADLKMVLESSGICWIKPRGMLNIGLRVLESDMESRCKHCGGKI